MRYFGGKQRISKPLSEFLNTQLSKDQTFVDLFCGSCNVVSNIRQDVKRIANDKNEYLIGMLDPTVDEIMHKMLITQHFVKCKKCQMYNFTQEITLK